MSHAEIINQKLMSLLFEFFKFPDNHIRLQKDILFCNFNPEHMGIYLFLFHCLPDISLNVPQQGVCGNVYGNFKIRIILCTRLHNPIRNLINDKPFQFRQYLSRLCKINNKWWIYHTIYWMVPTQQCLSTNTDTIAVYLWLIKHIQFFILDRML